jgi:hypothetical protein
MQKAAIPFVSMIPPPAFLKSLRRAGLFYSPLENEGRIIWSGMAKALRDVTVPVA